MIEMQNDIHLWLHLERELDMRAAAETFRHVRLLRFRRRMRRSGKPLFALPWLAIGETSRRIRHAIDSIVAPDHHGMGAR